MEERGIRWFWLLLPFAAAPLVSVAGYRAGRAKAARSMAHIAPPQIGSKIEHTLLVHVVGAVRKPGVVRLRSPARVVDAIEAAGGPREGADLDALNLAAFVKDGQRIEVPRKAPEAKRGHPPEAAPSKSKGRPAGRGGSVSIRRLEALVSRLERLLEGQRPPPVSPSRPIDVNLASAKELELLPGVGPSLARAIVERRRRNGPFRSVDELLEVPGIGPKTLERLRPLVVVRAEGSSEGRRAAFPINVNLASARELARIPGVGPSLAEVIVNWRETHGPFRAVGELTDVPGIGPKTLKRIEPYIVAAGPEKPLNLLTASLEEIAKIPGISEELAWEIVRLRAEGGLRSLKDLLTIEGFTKELLDRLDGWISVGPLKDTGARTPSPCGPPSEGRTESLPRSARPCVSGGAPPE